MVKRVIPKDRISDLEERIKQLELGGVGNGHQHIFDEPLTGLINGLNLIFTTANNFNSDGIEILYNGLHENNYSITASNEITLTEAPLPGDSLHSNYIKA